MCCDLAHQNLRAGASKIGHIMMLCHPVAFVAHRLCSHGQCDGLPQGVSRRAPFAHRRLIDNTKVQYLLHLPLPLASSPLCPLRTHPGLGPRQARCAAVPVAALLREWLPDSDTVVEGHLRPARRDKTTVYPMRTA